MRGTLVVDLDGTLVDSLPAIARALNRVLAARGLDALARPAIAAMVGDGVAVLLRRAFAYYRQAADATDLARFRADYDADPISGCALFPDAAEVLTGLVERGWRLAICTNKPVAPARAMLAAFGVADLFAAIGGGDSFATRKPDPAHLLATLEAAGGQVGQAVMLGDHANDIQAARGAGVPAVFAAWGYGAPGMALGAQAVAHGFCDIPPLLADLMAGN